MKYAIDTREKILLGGVEQSIRIRGTSGSNPVLLFLHGGPGVCDRHWVLKYQSSLADIATLVCWDQRGAGLSYSKALDDTQMTVARMVEDACELCEKLCARFGKEKLYIVGHSWGSLLGALLSRRHPEHIAAYIGMGQFVEGAENESLSYEFVLGEARRRGDKKALAALEKIGEPVNGLYKSMDDMMIQRDLMTKFGGGCWNKSESMMTSMVIPLILTPEYSLFDLKRYSDGAFYSLRMLWDEVVGFNLFREVPSLGMPVFLTEGRHDQNTPIPIAQRWFDALEAPKKEWIWFEESAHSPIKEEPKLWGESIRRILAQ